MSGKKKKASGSVNDKAVYVNNLVSKGNWPQIRKLAAQGIQSAVDALKKRQSVVSQEKDKKEAKA
jgi:hypothetical protein